MTDLLTRRVGREARLEDAVRDLNTVVRGFRAPLVGAVHVTCSDESERECTEVFQRRFVQTFLPSLKFGNPAPFRTVNLGGRYEWGSIRLAENHFSNAPGETGAKLIVVKINSHVSVVKGADGPLFGQMRRYRQEASFFCGAMRAALEGRGEGPRELLDAFESEGRNRLEVLADPARVPPELRYLYAALVNARLQARQAVVDIQDHRPAEATVYLVMSSVTLNRSEPDTELVGGLYYVDWRGAAPEARYRGLGDDPAQYRARISHAGIEVEDSGSLAWREARDHRRLVLNALEAHPLPREDHRFQEIQEQVADRRHELAPYAGIILKSLGALMLELSPIPAVLLLFGEGLIDIRNIYRMQRISRGVAGEEEARGLLSDVHSRLDSVPAERAAGLVEKLLEHHRQAS
jgi:hypothetical protein